MWVPGYGLPTHLHWEKRAKAITIPMRFRFPGVENRVHQVVSLWSSLSVLIACLIWAISKTTKGSRSSPSLEWYWARIRLASPSCMEKVISLEQHMIRLRSLLSPEIRANEGSRGWTYGRFVSANDIRNPNSYLPNQADLYQWNDTLGESRNSPRPYRPAGFVISGITHPSSWSKPC